MVGPYRNAAFNPANSNIWENNQLNLDGNLTTYLSPFPASVRDAFISHSYAATANTNVGGWNQTNPAATGRMVLPSMREIMDSGTWGLTQATRAAANNGFAHWAWLRSANADHSANVAVVAADGTLNSTDASGSHGVRPVVHIAVTALASNASISRTNTGTAGASATGPTELAPGAAEAAPAIFTFDAGATPAGNTITRVHLSGAVITDVDLAITATSQPGTWVTHNRTSGTPTGRILRTRAWSTNSGRTVTVHVLFDTGHGAPSFTLAATSRYNPRLSALSVEGFTISPIFSPETFAYTLTVPYTTASINVNATAVAGNTQGGDYGAQSLNSGENVFMITAMAPDGVTSQPYSLTVTRTAVCTISNLSTLTGRANGIGGNILTGVGQTRTATVAHTVTSISLQATTSSNFASRVFSVASVAHGSIDADTGEWTLPDTIVGEFMATVRVTPQSATPARYYTITITREADPTLVDAALSSLSLRHGINDIPISGLVLPLGGSTSTTHTFTVTGLSFQVSSLEVAASPRIGDAAIALTMNGTAFNSGDIVNLTNSGNVDNVLVIVATSVNGEVETVVTVNIRRALPNNNPALVDLVVSGEHISLMASFVETTRTYNLTGSEGAVFANIAFTLADINAGAEVAITNRNGTSTISMTRDGADFTGGRGLAPGNNAIVVSVTAENGTTIRSYTVNIVVDEAPNETEDRLLDLDVFNDTTNAFMQFSEGVFIPTNTNYTVEVSRFLTEIDIRVELETMGIGASFVAEINGTSFTYSPFSFSLNDLASTNELVITVTSPNGQEQQVYTINFIIERPPATPGPLLAPTNLAISAAGLITWNAVEGSTGYIVEINGATVASPTDNQHQIAGFVPGNYNVRVRATGDGEWFVALGPFSDELGHSFTVRLGTPENLTVVGGNLVWDSIADALEYRVYVAGAEGSPFTVFTNEFDFSLLSSGVYSITVVAVGDSYSFTEDSLASDTFVLTRTAVLEAPNLAAELNGNRIVWNTILNAQGYYVYIAGDRLPSYVLTRFVNIGALLGDGTHTIGIRSRAGEHPFWLNSDKAEITITIENSVIVCGGCGLDPCVCVLIDFCEECEEYPCICEKEPGSEPSTPLTLTAPTNLDISDEGILEWSAVANSSGYAIYINGQRVKEVDTNSVSLVYLAAYFSDGGEFTIGVRALGDGISFLNSDLSSEIKVAVSFDDDGSLVIRVIRDTDLCEDCGYEECICEDEENLGVFDWPGFPAIFMPWQYPGNFWPWFFWGVGLLLLLILLVIIPVSVTKKKRTKVDDGELDACRSKARDAINQAFLDLKQAGELVSACDTASSPVLEQEAMLQLSKTDAAMTNAEACVAEFLRVKKTDKKKAK